MTLQGSKPIALTDIEAEFGAPSGTPLSAFVRGGAWVPDSAANANVPTSPPIKLTDFLGAEAVSIKLTGQTLSAFALSPGTATVSVTFHNNGQFASVGTGGHSPADEWLNDQQAAVGNDYEVRCQVQSGDGPQGGPATNVFHPITGPLTWQLTTAGVGTLAGTWLLTVREIALTSNFVDATFNMSAESTP